MSADRDDPTPADYVVLALIPLLIMILVGSLVFFLLEVGYAGAYGGNMRWTLFFFVIAVVLIARISMMGETSGRAGCYAPALGVLTWLAMQRYVDYPADGPSAALRPLINLGLIALVWWCAHRLTRDCTYRGDEADKGGAGLLEASGLSEATGPTDGTQAKEGADAEKPAKPLGWLERYRRYREEQKKKRAQGVWVIYFSLAALPLFGLGQSLIPINAEERRQYAFWLMTLYVGSGLGLLLTTSFVGMRRYLRQRKLRMPAALTGVWLSMGAGLILVLLALGTFLPRPHSEYPLFDFTPANSPDAEASNFAQRGENAGKDKGRPGGEDKEDKEKEQGKDGEKDAQAKDGGEKDAQGKDGGGKDDKEKEKEKDKGGGKSEKRNATGKQGRSSRDSSRSGDPTRGLTSFLGNLGPILKWIVFGVVALIVLFVLLRSGLKFLANFLEWARRLLDALRNLFAGLFGGGKRTKGTEDTETERQPEERPFASFANPFDDGRAGRMGVKELLCYSFAALQAWARERGYPRHGGETPLEFAARLGDELPAMEAPARRLTNLFVRAVYAPEELPDTCVELIEAFWRELESAADRSVVGRGRIRLMSRR